jgi:hypothetical protein
MRYRNLPIVTLMGVVLGVASATPATAMDGPSVAEFVQVAGTTTAAGACNFLASGPSLDPSSTPYHLVGTATVVSPRVVVSTSLRCRLRLATGSRPQVGGALARALPLYTSAVAGDIDVASFGPFEICTYVDAVFEDTSHLNPAGIEACRPLTRI